MSEVTFAEKYRFTIDKKIGSGSFGSIYLGIAFCIYQKGNNIKTGEDLAIKMVT